MNRRPFFIAAIALLLMFCKGSTETTSVTATSATTAAQSTETSAPPPATQTVATQTSAPAAAAPSGGALATEDTNWPNITAEVTEFRRKGNSLTAKVRFTNKGSEEPEVEVQYRDVYLIDTAGGKKYQPLKDEKGGYIAAVRTGWEDRWSAFVKPGAPQTIWVKFPAPPPEVKSITLNIPKTPPFEDITIQD